MLAARAKKFSELCGFPGSKVPALRFGAHLPFTFNMPSLILSKDFFCVTPNSNPYFNIS
jgi:hypothetical protein